MKHLINLYAFNPETYQEIICVLDFTKPEEADNLFRQFSRLIAHQGYVLQGARLKRVPSNL